MSSPPRELKLLGQARALILVDIQSFLTEELAELMASLPVTVPITTGFSAGPLAGLTHPNIYRETNHSELQPPGSYAFAPHTVLLCPLRKLFCSFSRRASGELVRNWEQVALVHTPPDGLKRGLTCSDSSSVTKPLILGKLEEPFCTSDEKAPGLNCI